MFSTSLSLILLPLETTIHGFNVLNFTPKIRFNVLNLEKISHLERRFGALKRHMGHPCGLHMVIFLNIINQTVKADPHIVTPHHKILDLNELNCYNMFACLILFCHCYKEIFKTTS